MRVTSYAKVNLFLNVTGRRADGFHNIESVFQSVSFFDILTIEHSEKFSFSVESDAAYIPRAVLEKKNILQTCWEMLHQSYGVKPVRIILKKNIPIGAGLGGGSSNAAALLKALIHMNGLQISEAEQYRIAAATGSDVPFFLKGGTACVSGRGELVSTFKTMNTFYYVLIYPEVHVNTRTAFNTLCTIGDDSSLRHKYDVLTRWMCANHAEDQSKCDDISTHNSFQSKVFLQYPVIHAAYDRLKSHTGFSLLSGSGSTVFGLFLNKHAAEKAHKDLQNDFPYVFICENTPEGMNIEE